MLAIRVQKQKGYKQKKYTIGRIFLMKNYCTVSRRFVESNFGEKGVVFT